MCRLDAPTGTAYERGNSSLYLSDDSCQEATASFVEAKEI